MQELSGGQSPFTRSPKNDAGRYTGAAFLPTRRRVAGNESRRRGPAVIDRRLSIDNVPEEEAGGQTREPSPCQLSARSLLQRVTSHTEAYPAGSWAAAALGAVPCQK
jgi:hypothetical protein